MDGIRIDKSMPHLNRERTEQSKKSKTQKKASSDKVKEVLPQEKSKQDLSHQRRYRSYELHELIVKLDKVGQNLIKYCTMKVLEEYKQVLGAIIEFAVKRNEVIPEYKFTRKGKQVFVSIKQIEDRLTEITEMILNRESQRVKITQLIEEIKGAVLDLIS